MITMTNTNNGKIKATESFYKHPINETNEYARVSIQGVKHIKTLKCRGTKQQYEKNTPCNFHQLFFVYDVDVEQFEKEYSLLQAPKSNPDIMIYEKNKG